MNVTRAELVGKRRRVRPRRERDVQAAILEVLRKLPGVVAWKSGAGAFRVDGRFVRMGHKGVSDIIGWKCTQAVVRIDRPRYVPVARFIAIEVKAKGKHPTPEQWEFLRSVNDAGGIGIVAYSVDDVLAALR